MESIGGNPELYKLYRKAFSFHCIKIDLVEHNIINTDENFLCEKRITEDPQNGEECVMKIIFYRLLQSEEAKRVLLKITKKQMETKTNAKNESNWEAKKIFLHLQAQPKREQKKSRTKWSFPKLPFFSSTNKLPSSSVPDNTSFNFMDKDDFTMLDSSDDYNAQPESFDFEDENMDNLINAMEDADMNEEIPPVLLFNNIPENASLMSEKKHDAGNIEGIADKIGISIDPDTITTQRVGPRLDDKTTRDTMVTFKNRKDSKLFWQRRNIAALHRIQIKKFKPPKNIENGKNKHCAPNVFSKAGNRKQSNYGATQTRQENVNDKFESMKHRDRPLQDLSMNNKYSRQSNGQGGKRQPQHEPNQTRQTSNGVLSSLKSKGKQVGRAKHGAGWQN